MKIKGREAKANSAKNSIPVRDDELVCPIFPCSQSPSIVQGSEMYTKSDSSDGSSTKKNSVLAKRMILIKGIFKDRQEGQEVIKRGWMMKQGHFRKSWKKRFFILTPGLISYYSR